MTGLLEPTFKEVRLGVADVRNIFKVPKFGTIAGCMVTEGRITRSGDTPGAAAARQRGRLRGQDRIAPALQGRRQRGQGRLRVRHRLRASFNDIKVGDVIEVFVDGARRAVYGVGASSPVESELVPKAPVPTESPNRFAANWRRCIAREVHDPGIGFVTLTRVQVTPRPAAWRGCSTPRSVTTRRGANTDARARTRRTVSAPPDRRAAAAEARHPSSSSSTTIRSPARIASNRSSTSCSRDDARTAGADRDDDDDDRLSCSRSSTRFARGSGSCISSHARPDGDSIGSQLAMAFALRALGKEVARGQHRPGAAAAHGVSRRGRHRDRRPRRRRLRRGDHHGVRRSRAHRRRRARAVLRHQHRPSSGQHRLRRSINWFDASRGRMRRDGVRPDRGARRPAARSTSRRTSTSRSSPTPDRFTTRASRRGRSRSAARRSMPASIRCWSRATSTTATTWAG